MQPNETPNTPAPETPTPLTNQDTPTPQPQPEAQPQFQPQPPIGAPVAQEVPVQQPKKSKKKIWIIAIITAVVALAIAAGIIWNVQTSKANTAAQGYSDRVEESIITIVAIKITEGDTAGLKAFDERPALTDVWLGTTVSDEYKKASELESKFFTLTDEIEPFFRENVMFFDIINVYNKVTELAGSIPGEITSAEFAQATKEKGDEYAAVANTVEAYYFNEENRPAKDEAVKTMRSMSEAFLDFHDDLTENGAGNVSQEDARSALNLYTPIINDYYQKIKDFLQKTVTPYANELGERYSPEAKVVNEKLTAFDEAFPEYNFFEE